MGRRGRNLLTGVAIAIATPFLSAAADPTHDLPTLKRLFTLSEQHADYVLILDSSGSMKPLWPAVLRGAETFLEAIPDGEHVSIVFFDSRATKSRVLPRTLKGPNRGDLVRELRALPSPTGAHTDLGYALEESISELSRPGANKLQFVFFLSDFAHDPAPDSGYRSRDTNAAPWQELARRQRLSAGDRLLQTFALLLPLGGELGRDLPLVESVLGSLERISVGSPATLEEWFRQRRAEIERDKLRILVRADQARGWTARIDSSGLEPRLVVASGSRILPLIVHVRDLDTGGFAHALPAGAIEVPPAGSIELRLDLKSPAPAGMLERLLTTERRVTRPASLKARVTAKAEPSAEIGLLHLDAESSEELRFEGPLACLQKGTPGWLQVLVSALLLLGAWFAWSTWLRPPLPLGRGLRSITISSVAGTRKYELPKDARRRFAVGSLAGVDLQIESAAPQFAIVVESLRPAFPRLGPKRGVYVYRKHGPVKYRAKVLDPKTRAFVDGLLELGSSSRQAQRVTGMTRLVVPGGGSELVVTFSFV